MILPICREMLNRRLLVVLILMFCICQTVDAQEDQPLETSDLVQPNVLFIFSDDQAFDTIHAHGNDRIETPHLDQLARRGLTFTHAYNMGGWNGAICVASRSMLNTGRFLWHAESVNFGQELDEGRFWGPQLSKAGYRTYLTGKWHVSADANQAFNVAKDIRPGMPGQTKTGYNRPIDGQTDPWNPADPKFGGYWKGGKHWSEVVADNAIGFLDDAVQQEKPFFMYVAFNAPHDPRQSPQSYVDKYPADTIDLPQPFLAEYPYADPMGAGKNLRDEKLAPFPRTQHAVQVNRGEYYALITHLDDQIGRILAALKASGKSDNTYIFFTSDHGLACGHHGLLGKQNMYDHSVRVPFMVVGPGIAGQQTNDAPIYLQDIMPTTLELAGVEKPDYVEFQSLMPLITGKSDQSPYEAIYGAFTNSQRMITLDGHKLILYPNASVARLYDLEKDPLELTDLAGNPESKPIIGKLFARLVELQSEMGDKLELAPSYPEFSESLLEDATP